jgi:hypothetical protein
LTSNNYWNLKGSHHERPLICPLRGNKINSTPNVLTGSKPKSGSKTKSHKGLSRNQNRERQLKVLTLCVNQDNWSTGQPLLNSTRASTGETPSAKVQPQNMNGKTSL